MYYDLSKKNILLTLLNFDEWIYDFKTPDTLTKTLDTNPTNTWIQWSTWSVIKTPDTKSSTWSTKSPTWNTTIPTSLTWSQQPPITQTLTWNTQTWKTTEWTNNKEIEKVALKVKQTPPTWAETDVLILLTFVLNTAYFVRKKIINK